MGCGSRSLQMWLFFPNIICIQMVLKQHWVFYGQCSVQLLQARSFIRITPTHKVQCCSVSRSYFERVTGYECLSIFPWLNFSVGYWPVQFQLISCIFPQVLADRKLWQYLVYLWDIPWSRCMLMTAVGNHIEDLTWRSPCRHLDQANHNVRCWWACLNLHKYGSPGDAQWCHHWSSSCYRRTTCGCSKLLGSSRPFLHDCEPGP